jgi:DNA/RNA endonuclease G (NUC1)/uncharacterized protein YjdB/PKD repeat protein
VISQIYGGGGNSGATYKNDFIEIFNPGTQAVDVGGWSVQYVSGTGTGTWSVTSLAGMIQPGAYYLVQEAVGAGGTVNLPTPDATGSIAMAATSGKVALVQATTALIGGCAAAASSANAVDVVGYGTTSSTDCASPAPTLSNTTADLRGDGGCTYTGNPPTDFATGSPSPRNSASTHTCGGTQQTVDHITVTGATTILAGSSAQLAATAFDATNAPLSSQPAFTWSSSDPTIVDVNPTTGSASGVGAGTATITASAGGKSGSISITVSLPANVVGKVVISQIYGGGGNSGAAYKKDFIEIFNRSTDPVSLDGWSVQYASSAGTFDQATLLSGTLLPGHYYLVSEAAGTGGTLDLPTPDVVGAIPMAAGSGKILLAQVATPVGVACPTGSIVVDEVGYGVTCGATAPSLANTTAAIRKNGGCLYTSATSSTDFVSGAPTPRNTGSSTRSCVVGPLDHVAISGNTTVLAGGTSQLTADALDANENPVTGATITWLSSDPSIATVNASGLVTGVSASATTATITATATANSVTKSASVDVIVNNPGGINWIDVSYQADSMPPGFQSQMFLTAREASGGTVIPATFAVEALDPSIALVVPVPNATIIQGVAAPLIPGTRPRFKITATPSGGGTAYVFTTGFSTSIPITVPVNAPLSIYASNNEFGNPSAANNQNPDDLLIARAQYVLSYNESRGTPNWVSYELDTRQFGQTDRCNCFTADPNLPANKQVYTSDYTNGGFDRGHMTRSADRTAANVDNGDTFFLTNVVPQQADLNQGVWAQFENAVADTARAGRAVYIITGPLYSRTHGLTFLKNEGKVAIPDSTWKVVLIGPRNGGSPFTRSNLQTWDDLAGLTVMAVNMPNVAGVRNDPWQKYLTTPDRIEEATGLDFLSLIPTAFQDALEAEDHAPVAAFSFSGTQNEGSAISFDASASTDPDFGRTDLGRAEALTYSWHFSDDTNASGKTVSHTFADNGTYTATLLVSDAFGWQKMVSHDVIVANVAPTVSFGATTPLSILSGDAVSVSGSFTDPGSDAAWHAVIDWGNGTTSSSNLSVSGATVTGSSTYLAIGTHTISLAIADKDGASDSKSLTVDVARRPVAGDATPTSVSLSDPLDGDVKITLYSDARSDVTKLDLATVRIGSVGLIDKKVKLRVDPGGTTSITLRFDKQALVDAGVITPSTTQLEIIGDLSTGMQIVSHVAFTAH